MCSLLPRGLNLSCLIVLRCTHVKVYFICADVQSGRHTFARYRRASLEERDIVLYLRCSLFSISVDLSVSLDTTYAAATPCRLQSALLARSAQAKIQAADSNMPQESATRGSPVLTWHLGDIDGPSSPRSQPSAHILLHAQSRSQRKHKLCFPARGFRGHIVRTRRVCASDLLPPMA